MSVSMEGSEMFPFSIGKEQECVTKTESELRYLIETVMTHKHGVSWLSTPDFGVKDYTALLARQKDDAMKFRNNATNTINVIEYCYIHELKEIIEKNWNHVFANIFHSRDRTLQLLEVLSEYRNPIMHGRNILLTHQKHLCLGICGEILLTVDKWRIGTKHQVRSYECTFAFRVPKGTDSEKERMLVIENTKTWLDGVADKAIDKRDKSNDKLIEYLLRLPEGHVTISSAKKEGEIQVNPNSNGWTCYVTARTDNIRVIRRIVSETDKPYWVYKMHLFNKLDIDHIRKLVKERTEQEPTGGSSAHSGNRLLGQSIVYPFGKLNSAVLRVQFSDSSEEQGSTVQITIDGSDEGFYRADDNLTHEVILSCLTGEYTPMKKLQLIKEACSPSLSLSKNNAQISSS
jgi:hypothetical protein